MMIANVIDIVRILSILLYFVDLHTALTGNSAMLVQKHNKDHATLDHFFGLGKRS